MQKIKNKKFIIITTVVFALILLGGFIYSKNQAKSSNPDTKSSDYINTNPPTDEEKASGDAIKPTIVKKESDRNNTTSNQSGKTKVVPTITYAEQYDKQVEVGSYVNGVFEDGGSCTLSLTSGSKSATAVVYGIKGSNNVNCPVLSVPVASLSNGTWIATVTYSSSSAEGSSVSRNIEVEIK